MENSEDSIEENIKTLRESIIEEKYHIFNKDLKKAIENLLSEYKRVLKENEKLEEKIERQQDMIKNALYIINKNEKEKVDQIWLYNFDKCAIWKGDNK